MEHVRLSKRGPTSAFPRRPQSPAPPPDVIRSCRFFTTGRYWREGVVPTIAPSMDICVSSNFERFLFHLCGDDGQVLKGWLGEFEKTGTATV